VPVHDVAAALDCPRNYLSKTLHVLVRAGVLRSERGPGGGFSLADASDRLTLARIVAPFEPVDARRSLPSGRSRPRARRSTALAEWTRLARQVDRFFATTTVARLLRDPPHPNPRMRAAARSSRSPNPRMSHGSNA
jgi:Rrf2 family protein